MAKLSLLLTTLIGGTALADTTYTTLAASDIRQTKARLNGIATTTCPVLMWFKHGPSPEYNNVTIADPAMIANTTAAVHLDLDGLFCDTNYYFQFTGEFCGNLTDGAHLYFRTLPCGMAPAAPSMVVAVAGDGDAVITFKAPNDGGSPITGYSVKSNPPRSVDSDDGSTSLRHVVTGLINGTSYTFTVRATNALGTSRASPASNPVTPMATIDMTAVQDMTVARDMTTTIDLKTPSDLSSGSDLLITLADLQTPHAATDLPMLYDLAPSNNNDLLAPSETMQMQTDSASGCSFSTASSRQGIFVIVALFLMTLLVRKQGKKARDTD